MDGILDAIERLANSYVQRQDVRDTDYIGEDGIPVCGVCGEPRRRYLDVGEKKILVTRMCRCDREAEAKAELDEHRRKAEEDARNLKRWSMMDDSLSVCTFMNWKRRPENEYVYAKCLDYARRFSEYEKENIGLMLWGDVGTGKSYAAAAIANRLVGEGVSVLFTSLVKVLGMSQDALDGFMERAESARLLILDDVGAERRTDYAIERVYDVIDSRCRAKKPLIVTTNLLFEDMKSETDVRYSRIYDRIFEMCVPIQFQGKSFRKIVANERYAKMQERWKNDRGDSGVE